MTTTQDSPLTQPCPPGRPERSGGFVAHAMVVGAMTFISRLLGLARDAVLAACFGMTAVTDAFWVAFIIPNLFRRLFGEGAMTAAFVPTYTELLKKDPVVARRLTWLCVSVLLVLLGLIVLVGELVLATALELKPWSTDTRLAIHLTQVMLPYMPMICVAALVGGVLQVHGRFGPPAFAPVLLNVVMIAVTLLVTVGGSSQADPRRAITIVAWAVVASGLLQMLWQFWGTVRHESPTFQAAGAWAPLKSIMWVMLPMVFALAVFQLNTLADSLVAWSLSPKEGGPEKLRLLGWELAYPIAPGAVTAMGFAQRIYQFPLGVFGIALATAIFPAFAKAAPHRNQPASPENPDGQPDLFREILQHGLRLTVFVGLPASVGLILIRLPLSRVIFERHQFGIDDSARVATILAGYASGIWAYSMTHVLTRAFHAVKDSRTPLRASMAMLVLNVSLNLSLVWWVGVAALAWATAIGAVGQSLMLLRMVRRYVRKPVDAAVWRSWTQSAMLSALMAVVLGPITYLYDPMTLTRGQVAIELAVMVSLGVLIVWGGAKLLKAQELDWLWNRST